MPPQRSDRALADPSMISVVRTSQEDIAERTAFACKLALSVRLGGVFARAGDPAPPGDAATAGFRCERRQMPSSHSEERIPHAKHKITRPARLRPAVKRPSTKLSTLKRFLARASARDPPSRQP